MVLRLTSLRFFLALLLASIPVLAQKPRLVVQTGHLKAIVAVAISPDGKLIASGSEDQTVKLWETATMRELRTFKGYAGDLEGTQNKLMFTPNGEILVGGDKKGVTLWSVSQP